MQFGIWERKIWERKQRRLWRKLNRHNETKIVRVFQCYDNIRIGRYTYGPIDILSSSQAPSLRIGDFCSIANEVTFVTVSGHPIDHLSTFPFRVMMLKNSEIEALDKGGIVVDDDVWIGYRATILDGVHIGQGAIVGAGAVVTKDVPPYAVVGGVPAKVIRFRFDGETIGKLLQLDYSKLSLDIVKKLEKSFYAPLTDSFLNSLNEVKR